MDRLGLIDWRWVLARGVLGILFGILVFVFPFTSLLAVAFLFAAYVTVDGLMSLSSAFSRRKREEGKWGWLALEGVLSVIAGMIGFFYPGLALLTLIILMSVWALATGIVELYAAIAYRKIVPNPVLFGLAGAVSLAFGLLVMSRPVAGAAMLLAMIGTYSIFFGGLLTAWAFKLRQQSRKEIPEGGRPHLQPT